METGWMIENKVTPPMWWNGLSKRKGKKAWTTDPLEGVRFARQEDAQVCAVSQGYKLSIVRVTEHGWG